MFLPVAIPVAIAVLALSFLYGTAATRSATESSTRHILERRPVFHTIEVLAGKRRALIPTTVDGRRITLDDTIKPVVDPSTDTVGVHECMTIMNVDVEGSDVVTDACTAKLPADLVEEVSWALGMAECLDVPSCSATAVLTPPSKTATGSSAATHTGSTTAPAAAATTTGATTGTDPAKNAGERVAMVGTAGLAVAFSVFGLLLA